MAVLTDHIRVTSRFARSANVERDIAATEPLDGYVVTARALDVVERVASAAADGVAGGAWSLTGPYGSGKSSLALLLDAAWSDDSAPRRAALKLIADASPTAAELIAAGHERHGTHESGFHRGLVTAGREPLSRTVLRALHGAVVRSFGRVPPATEFKAADALRGAMEDAAADDPRRTGPSPAALVEVARTLAADRPLLVVIDEFGKNLEAIGAGGDTDPYLLQQLAEAGQGAGLPIFLLTLQHLSFEDYLAGVDGPQRREWAKVQGRFEDVAFVESPAQTRALIATVFKAGRINGEATETSFRGRIDRWAAKQADAMRQLGIADLADPATVASCYPLHPLVSLVLPELCSRYGQHERTLFSFLTGSDSSGAASFLARTNLPARGRLPSLNLEAVYDYFVASNALGVGASGRSSRWTEITTRLRDAHGLSASQRRLAKTIAVLNLVATSGTLRASRKVLGLAEGDVDETLAQLEAAGLVTYRSFADEYRIWQGTDVDITDLLDAAHHRVKRQSLVDLLAAVEEPPPVVAARHSAEHHLLRVFAQRYAASDEPVEPLDAFSDYDGEVLLIVGPDLATPELRHSPPAAKSMGAGTESTYSPFAAAAKPMVAAIPDGVGALESAAREVAAVKTALDDPSVADDWVARRELGERLAQSRAELDCAVASTFGTRTCRWVLLNDRTNGAGEAGGNGDRGSGKGSDERELAVGRGSAPLSEAADIAYPDTPTVRNEMLNRTNLTSQGAKARRLLIEAMIERGDQAGLGLDGHGPEVAMYRAFLLRTGLHGPDGPSPDDDPEARNKTIAFRQPSDPALQATWDVMAGEFKRSAARRVNLDDVYAALLSPPIGMKAGVVPVLVVAGLLAFSDEVAVYEHGTFVSVLTPEVAERLVRNPNHFDVKHFANTSGARRQVTDELAIRLGVRPRFGKHRVANVLSVVGHLMSEVSQLDNFTLRTGRLSPAALEARDALVTAVEPDELLFDALPKALGFRPISAKAKSYSQAGTYAEAVGSALDELSACGQNLLGELLRLLLDTSAESTRLAVTGQAASLTGEVLDPGVRAFVLTLANNRVETDEDWAKAVATVVAQKAPTEWTDEDFERFQSELPQQVAAFQRLVALHAERRAHGGGPFEAHRITVTRSDGSECVQLVSIDESLRGRVEQVLDETLDRLESVIGSRGRAHRSLLALLGERALPEQSLAEPPAAVLGGEQVAAVDLVGHG